MTGRSLKIGHDSDFAALTFLAGGESLGLMVEIVREVLGDAGYEARFIPLPFPCFEAALAAGEIDALAMQAIVPERHASRDFSAPFAVSGGAWFPPAGSAWDPERPPGGARVVTPRSGPLTAEIARDFPALSVLACASYGEALAQVLAGNADAAALNLQVGTMMARRDFPAVSRCPKRRSSQCRWHSPSPKAATATSSRLSTAHSRPRARRASSRRSNDAGAPLRPKGAEPARRAGRGAAEA